MPNSLIPAAPAGSTGPTFRSVGGRSIGGARAALDNLIRRELKVGDPNDAAEVAQALMNRYRDDPRARAMAQEAQGLPYLPAQPASTALPVQEGATSLDLAQASDDVARDLRTLTSSNLTKDITPELEGWTQAINSAIMQGLDTARRGMDTRSRDIAFAMRRQLGDYARGARMLGALTPSLSAEYRNLGQSLDEISALILVLMGEALANTGMAGGRYLLQSPFSDLQTRRDVALNALRNLTGAAQEAFAPNDWSRGIDAYRQLFLMFEAQGHGELRALLMENELARVMDELIQLAGNGAASGLRALGATAWGHLNRFKRFVQLTVSVITPPAPPLVAFQDALLAFVDGFAPAGGARLLRVARPAVLFYGLYGSAQAGKADSRLMQLVIIRGAIAFECDGLTGQPEAQMLGDQMLYSIDRAIDLYCIGAKDLGIPEARASAYSFVLQAARDYLNDGNPPAQELIRLLGEAACLLRPPLALSTTANGFSGFWDNASVNTYEAAFDHKPHGPHDEHPWNVAMLVQEIQLLQQADQKLFEVVGQMSTTRLLSIFIDILTDVYNAALALVGSKPAELVEAVPVVPSTVENALNNIRDVLERRLPNGGTPPPGNGYAQGKKKASASQAADHPPHPAGE
ncbi:hypothetical protein [Massilia sp. S19_KUP03_FR1]|uniref:hypothetical protein n=1 Tax=Massilia sp. S19_KUP03_FR1 TaxID=3025503 RepID=UPI002FCD91ED